MRLAMVTGVGGAQQQNMVPNSSGSPAPGDGQKRSSGDHRRSNKPIMEKRRRARINNCLNELKTLILDAMKKDPARHSKLEKADILEMTVKHLENLQRQQVAADPSVVNKFRAGFSECAGEVGRFPGLEPAVKRRLLQHLANCLTGSQAAKPDSTQTQVHILPSPPSSPEHANTGITGGIFLSNGTGTGVQLMPTRLPNGDIALILPSQSATAITTVPVTVSPLPMLIPIPSRTSSTSSASSSMSSGSSTADPVCRIVTTATVIRQTPQPVREKVPSPAPCYSPVSQPEREWSPSSTDSQGSYSPVPGRFSPSIDENSRPYSPEQVPLSLVMRRDPPSESDDEKPWRPW